MIHSLIQILVFYILFLAVYDFFLKKETFFDLNRIYLLATPILATVFPFLNMEFIQKSIPTGMMVQLPAVVLNDISKPVSEAPTFWFPSLWQIWLIGAVLSTAFLLLKFYGIAKLYAAGTTVYYQGAKLKMLPETSAAFSFFNTIFLGDNISEENKATIIAHEKIHLQQKHSWDLLYFELLRIILWFNPGVYLYQSRMAALHEFIADEKVAAKKDKKQYYQNLLSEVFCTEKISFINTFFNHSLIKKRISMLRKSKSPKSAQLKYLLLLPAICCMVFYTACSNDPKAEETQTVQRSDSEIMNKINELADAIMEKGEMTPEEEKALKLLTTEAQPGDKVYTSVQEYLDETSDGSDLPVPFAAIEKVPVFPGCTGATNEEMKLCMSQKIATFVGQNFNANLGKELGLTGRQRIAIQFKIDKTGKIVDVKARAPRPELEAEAVRVVEKLPQMQPGEQKGEKVGVIYSLPIVFEVEQ